jgi:hypothetical protein
MTEPDCRGFPIISELIKCLVAYSETLRELPEDAELIPQDEQKPECFKVFISSPEDRVSAILDLLFGKEIQERSAKGPKGFLKHDLELMEEMREEKIKTGKSRDELIWNYVERAKSRDPNVDEDSIRRRLINADQDLSKKKKIPDYSAYKDFEVEYNFVEDELQIISPWLNLYREELINVFKP